MSLRKNELQRSQRARRRQQKKSKKPQRPSTLAAPLPMTSLHGDQVLSFTQWCTLNHVSERTGRRIIAGPNGPVVTRLSAKRIGVTVSNNQAWQACRASKEVANKSAAPRDMSKTIEKEPTEQEHFREQTQT